MVGIYQIKCKVNNKSNVGQSVDIQVRWTEHLRNIDKGVQHPLYDAVRKYGRDNFSFIVLAEIDESKLGLEEINTIKNLKTLYPSGYNLTEGGTGGNTRKYLSSKQIEVYNQKLRDNSSMKNPDNRKKHKQAMQKVRERRLKGEFTQAEIEGKLKVAERRSKGIWTNKELEGFKKLSQQKVGEKNPRAQKIKCLETGKIYGSISTAEKNLGYNSNTPILGSCRTGKKTRLGHTFIRV